MNFYKLIIQYDGTDFHGFQIQKEERTIQGELLRVLCEISKSTQVKTIGSGRTDAGVHALGQVVKVEMELNILPQALLKAMNSLLPLEIRVIDVEVTNADFHPIYSAKSKEYNYLFYTSKISSPFLNQHMTQYDYEFDLDKFREGCSLFLGEHDFVNYQCTGTEIATTVRTIIKCELIKVANTGFSGQYCPEYYQFIIEGNGFLKQMVRLIIGALWNYARGKISRETLMNSLKTPMNNRLGAVAPPQGLYLVQVHY